MRTELAPTVGQASQCQDFAQPQVTAPSAFQAARSCYQVFHMQCV